MFVVFLKFAENKSKAPEFMDGHNAWVKQGFNDNVFLMAGSLQPGLGGAIFAHGCTPDELQQRVEQDPFVQQGIVKAEINEISPAMTDERLAFVMND